jgi:hypothetical protein
MSEDDAFESFGAHFCVKYVKERCDAQFRQACHDMACLWEELILDGGGRVEIGLYRFGSPQRLVDQMMRQASFLVNELTQKDFTAHIHLADAGKSGGSDEDYAAFVTIITPGCA